MLPRREAERTKPVQYRRHLRRMAAAPPSSQIDLAGGPEAFRWPFARFVEDPGRAAPFRATW